MITFSSPGLNENNVNDIWVQSEELGAIFYNGWKFELFRHWSVLKPKCWLILYQKPIQLDEELFLKEQPVQVTIHYSDEEEPIEICKEFYKYISFE